MKPLVIVFEGIDCSGKSNIIRLVMNELDSNKAILLKGVDNVDEKNYRDLLVNKDIITDVHIRATLYNSALSECYEKILTSIALKKEIILLDRSHISMFAYQHKANPINIFNNSYTKVRWEKILATCNVVFIYLNVDENILKEKNPNLIIVDMSKGVDKLNNNPYIWMDPFAMRIIAKNVYETFIEIDKNRKDFYQENYERFLDEIDDTFLKIKQKMSGSEITTIYAFDDYWDIFANRFRLNIIKKEKKYLNISDVSETLEFTQNKNIKKLLFYRGMDYNIALSLSSNLNVEILEDDIFGDNWQYNLLNLSQNLFK